MAFLQNTTDVRVIFSTSGDTAEAITDVLTGTPGSVWFSSVLHDCLTATINTRRMTVGLCLPVKRPGSGPRCRPVLVLQLEPCNLLPFLGGRALSAHEVESMLIPECTHNLFEPMLELLGGAKNRDAGNEGSFQSRVFWVRAKFVSALRKLFKVTPSPYWMISAFGHQEAPFVLAASFYYFQEEVCTAETLGHLARLFSSNCGQTLASINSYEELGRLFDSSRFRSQVWEFSIYARKKLARDTLEMDAVDNTINEIRRGLLLSNQDLVHFVYLAFFQCLNARAFMKYCHRSAPSELSTMSTAPMLCQSLEGEFRTQVQAYYDRASYLSNYIEVNTFNTLLPPGYETQVLRGENGRYWCGQSQDVSSLIAAVNGHVPQLYLQEEFGGLLDMAAIAGSEGGQCKEGLLSSNMALPVYRCEFLSRQFFVMMGEDDLEHHWTRTVIHPPENAWRTLTDEDLTRRIYYYEASVSCPTLKQQLLLSRHEYFNPRLPVYRWVLDFDLPVTEPTRTFADIRDLCLALRCAILEILQILGPLDPHKHPVYFFKSACPPDDWYTESVGDVPFCRCHPKLGLRIISPFPDRVAVVGSEPMIALTDILNRVVKLDAELVRKYPAIHHNRGPFDTGIYHRGRSIRLPHCYKVGLVGELTRQLRLVVCHPEPTGRWRYMREAFTLSKLLHHAPGTGAGQNGHLVYRVRDINQNFLEHKTASYLPTTIPRIIKRLPHLLDGSLEHWLEFSVWGRAMEVISKFFPEDRISQFSGVTFVVGGDNLIQLKPRRGGNFLCINHNHKNRSKGVRIFLVLHAIKETEVIVTLMSQCFANKCNSNVPTAHFSFTVPVGMAT
ncbi:ORF56 [Retroperitoneal fibromatosis-associated herpesvirus]|uniref:ORF56 n=1 Tax=Retroperitoneal fibromatosis-associated herpesvirus TaxID=111469 RepID=U5NM72_9GAMA|nr:ORF56 [Retroperitoneal fibromatosis-associated herpesvirus]AGY30738.1 ORF56 [Retroperitoneal fibromatosis-associated herpesvirus]